MDERERLKPAAAPVAPPLPAGSDRAELIAVRLTSILADLSGLAAATLERNATFATLGFDSLFLTLATSRVRKEFGVRVTLRQLLNEANTIHALALHLDSELGPGDLPAHGRVTEAHGKPPIELSAGDLQPPAALSTSSPVDVGETPTIDALAERIDVELAPDALAPVAGPAPEADEHPPQREASAGLEYLAADEVERLIAEQLRIMEQQLDLMRLHVGRETRQPAPDHPGASEEAGS